MYSTTFIINRFYFYSLFLIAPLTTFANSLGDIPIKSVCDVSNGANVIGLAISPDSTSPLYCEYHFEEYEGGVLTRSLVKYIDNNGHQFADKQLDFTQQALAPNVIQRDMRQGETRTMVYSPKEKHFLLEYKKNSEATKKTALLDSQGTALPVVADAGFDIFIKESWSELLSENAVDFSFLSPVHAREITLRVSLETRKTCGSYTYDAETSACFTVKPKSSLLKLFAKPLFLLYNQSSQQLEVFSGVVNLMDDQQQSQMANIYYWHKP